MTKTTDYVLRVYRRDLRQRSGERLIKTERFENVTEDWIRAYSAGVQGQAGVTRVEYQEQWVTVKNLLSGKDVVIRSEERGTCCDPSTETYHCM